MLLPHEQTSVTYLTVLIRAFIDPFLKLSAFLVTSVLVFCNSSSDLNLGMKLVSSTLCIIVVVKARVTVIVQLTNLWKSKNRPWIKLVNHICWIWNHKADKSLLQRYEIQFHKPNHSRSLCYGHNTSQWSHQRQTQSVSWPLPQWLSTYQLLNFHHPP